MQNILFFPPHLNLNPRLCLTEAFLETRISLLTHYQILWMLENMLKQTNGYQQMCITVILCLLTGSVSSKQYLLWVFVWPNFKTVCAQEPICQNDVVTA